MQQSFDQIMQSSVAQTLGQAIIDKIAADTHLYLSRQEIDTLRARVAELEPNAKPVEEKSE